MGMSPIDSAESAKIGRRGRGRRERERERERDCYDMEVTNYLLTDQKHSC